MRRRSLAELWREAARYGRSILSPQEVERLRDYARGLRAKARAREEGDGVPTASMLYLARTRGLGALKAADREMVANYLRTQKARKEPEDGEG